MNRYLKITYALLHPPIRLFLKLRFGYRFQMLRRKELPEKYIVLSNHVTDYDPLFVAASFPKQMYFVASEHIARWKHAYKWIRLLFDPILRSKGTNAYTTVMDVLRKLRAGASVCIFAEGARTWDGITGPILPSTGKMVKRAGCALITYKIEGGYFVSPNWSEKNTRRGRIYGAPVRIYSAEEISAMSADEINAIIRRDLHEDAYARQLADPAAYVGKNLACRMENLLFRCPKCNAIDSIRSHGDTVSCKECGMTFRYNQYGMLEDAPFQTVSELAAWQNERVAEDAANGACYTAPDGTLTEIAKHTEIPVASGAISLGRDGLQCANRSFALHEITDIAMHGRRAIVFSAKGSYYELIPSPDSNALKFHLLCNAYQTMN